MERRSFLKIAAVGIAAFFFPVITTVKKVFGCDICEKVDVVLPNGKVVVGMDSCIADLVVAMNKVGYETTSSCCGHGRTDGYILCKDRLFIISKEKEPAAVLARFERDFHPLAMENNDITGRCNS